MHFNKQIIKKINMLHERKESRDTNRLLVKSTNDNIDCKEQPNQMI